MSIIQQLTKKVTNISIHFPTFLLQISDVNVNSEDHAIRKWLSWEIYEVMS